MNDHLPRTGDVIPELGDGLKQSILNIDGFGKPLKSPINTRYAFDCTNRQIWSTRKAARYGVLFGEGLTIAHEYKGSGHMVKNGAGVDIVGNATTGLYMISDSAHEARARRLAGWRWIRSSRTPKSCAPT